MVQRRRRRRDILRRHSSPLGMCQHHGLTSQSLMSGGSHMSLLGSSGSSGMSGSGVGSSGQGVPMGMPSMAMPQCPAAEAALLAASSAGGHCRSLSGLSSISIPPPPALFNPCSSALSLQQAAATRWGPRTSCPVHSPFRVRVPNGSICSGHQVRAFGKGFTLLYLNICTVYYIYIYI